MPQAATPAPGPLTDRELAAWRGLLRAHRDIVARLDAQLEAEHGLPLSSYEVLISLADAESGRLRMGELADRLLLSRSGLTRLVDRLARQGLVERARCDSDARGFFAVITPAGRELLERARPSHWAGVREHFLGRLEPGDLEALAGVWSRLADD